MEFPCTDFTQRKKKNFVTFTSLGEATSSSVIIFELKNFLFNFLPRSTIRTLNRATLPIIFLVFFPTSHCHHTIERITFSTHHTICCLCSMKWKWGSSGAGVCCFIKERSPSKSLIWSSGILAGWWAEGEWSHRHSRGNSLVLSSVVCWGNNVAKFWKQITKGLGSGLPGGSVSPYEQHIWW